MHKARAASAKTGVRTNGVKTGLHERLVGRNICAQESINHRTHLLHSQMADLTAAAASW